MGSAGMGIAGPWEMAPVGLNSGQCAGSWSPRVGPVKKHTRSAKPEHRSIRPPPCTAMRRRRPVPDLFLDPASFCAAHRRLGVSYDTLGNTCGLCLVSVDILSAQVTDNKYPGSRFLTLPLDKLGTEI
ncbi:hypothetical protein JB92DRAFT_2832422 [Gautieria morchelliformis]|nr:hypothetical protein JB92DRAFT_2832422 [Gautieria morchelliformis]